MKKALVVGIDHYSYVSPLFGCVNDAVNVQQVLERHADGSVNFGVKVLLGESPHRTVDRSSLRTAIRELFADDSECALFYFAGHGYIESTGGYLIASDSKTGDDGVPLSDVISFANNSPARNKIIVLDSCHSGIAGERDNFGQPSEIAEGVTILTASTATQYANEKDDSGVFTNLFVDALMGAAGNLVGDITPGGIYAHIDQSLGPWEQRPVFKTNVKSFFSIRTVQAPIPLEQLQRITEFFPEPGSTFQLDPAYEPESDHPDPKKNEKFAILQNMNRVYLVEPEGRTHMYHAAMDSKACKLTVLGEHYRRLVASGNI